MTELFYLLTSMVLILGIYGTFCISQKDNLRFSVKTTYIIYFIYSICALFCSGHFYFNLVTVTVCVILPLVTCRTKHINCYIMQFMIMTIMNTFPNFCMAVMGVITAYITEGKGIWFTMDKITPAILAGMLAAFILSIHVANKACIIFKDIIMNMRPWIRNLTFSVCYLPYVINTYAKGFYPGNYSNNPGGIYFIADCMCMVAGLILIICCTVTRVTAITGENRRIEEQIQRETDFYRECISFEEDVRHLRHDLRNFAEVGTEELRNGIIGYCNSLIEKGERNLD